ncbi:diaminobutyrate--2-oxoglutarate transaminase [Gulosibacter hominis]|uniref:diaminobutyrate--2-oxoglutarate transaminase n=1 Tax=Gulosibacter hominis TaxID=2770504 RepID=UPI00191B7413|nr:diaminobutyrate--2-oxoglutarate transaminase [Gulosibacter hominis]
MNLSVFDQTESEVRSYIRSFPTVFTTAKGSKLTDEDGREYIDFFCGAGAVNYGHNDPDIQEAVIEFLRSDQLQHALDMATTSKRHFLELFRDRILAPRGLDYRVQFTGPTGANTVEAALKLARMATGRTGVVAFTHGYHGLSLGALAATANQWFRQAAGTTLNDVTFHPYDGYYGDQIDTVALLRKHIEDPSSGLDLPAAIIVETVQGEGGVNVASAQWLRDLRALCDEYGIVLICDEIQIGIGRSGKFFGFEESGIVPDMVTLSKSLSGYGFPMSLLLIKPELDKWQPAMHTGTFRGNSIAFVGAAKSIEKFWSDDQLENTIAERSDAVVTTLNEIAEQYPGEFSVRGRGLLQGLVCEKDRELAGRISRAAFERGLVVETAGAYDEVVKIMPTLNGDMETLKAGLSILRDAVAAARG